MDCKKIILMLLLAAGFAYAAYESCGSSNQYTCMSAEECTGYGLGFTTDYCADGQFCCEVQFDTPATTDTTETTETPRPQVIDYTPVYNRDSGYGKCGQPQEKFNCEKIVDGQCPDFYKDYGEFQTIRGLCPRYGNDVLCCIPKQVNGTNPYGNCADPYEDSTCQLVTRDETGRYICPNAEDRAVKHKCIGSASFIQCCVSPEKIKPEDAVEKKSCRAPFGNYDCMAAEACSGDGDPDYCSNGQVCCVPLSAYKPKEYIYDNAKVIDDNLEKNIDNILEALDNPNKAEAAGKTRMYFVMQTENASIDMKMRFDALRLNKVQPSALIVLNLQTRTFDIVANGRHLTAELDSVTKSGNIKSLLDNSKYYDGLYELAKYLDGYALSYSKISRAANDFNAASSCENFRRLVSAIAEEMNVPDKAGLVSSVLANANLACDRTWKKAVAGELTYETDRLAQTIKDAEASLTFLSTNTPSCDMESIGKYACIMTDSEYEEVNGRPQLKEATYEVRRCTPTKAYATATTVTLRPGASCVSAGPGADDYFDSGISAFLGLSGGQIRCVNNNGRFSLAQCTGSWNTGSNPIFYNTQEECARACNTLDNVKNYCTEPMIGLAAYDVSRNIIKNGATIEKQKVTIWSTNMNQYQSKLDRAIYHAVKYKITDGQNTIERRAECPSKSTCSIEVPELEQCEGCTLQYWSEMSFQETSSNANSQNIIEREGTTYIRSPAAGVNSFKIAGTFGSEALPSNTQNSEVYNQWGESWDGKEYTSYAECRTECWHAGAAAGNGCASQQESNLPQEVSWNLHITDYIAKRSDISDLKTELQEIQQLRTCYDRSTGKAGDFNACINTFSNSMANYNAKTGTRTDCAARGNCQFHSNARVQMLKDVDANFAQYDKDPGMTVCQAAQNAATSIEAMSVLAERKALAYQVVIEKCAGVNNSQANVYLNQAVQKTTTEGYFKDPFTRGIRNRLVAITHPTVLAVGAGIIVGEIVAKAIPVGGDIVLATQISRGVRVVKMAVEGYFAYEVGKSMIKSSVNCYNAGILDSAACGEAFADAVMFVPLVTGVYKNGKATLRITRDLGEYTRVRAEIERVSGEFKQSLDEVAVQRAKLQRARTLEDAATADKIELERKVRAKASEITSMESEITSLRNSRRGHQSARTRLENDLDDLEADGKGNTQAALDVQSNIQVQENSIAELDSQITELQTRLSTTKGLRTRYTNELNELRRTDLRRTQNKVDEATDELDDMKNELTEKKNMLDSVSENGKKLLAELIKSGDLTTYMKRTRATIIKNEFKSVLKENKKSGRITGCAAGFCPTGGDAGQRVADTADELTKESRSVQTDPIVMKTPDIVGDGISTISRKYRELIDRRSVQTGKISTELVLERDSILGALEPIRATGDAEGAAAMVRAAMDQSPQPEILAELGKIESSLTGLSERSTRPIVEADPVRIPEPPVGDYEVAEMTRVTRRTIETRYEQRTGASSVPADSVEGKIINMLERADLQNNIENLPGFVENAFREINDAKTSGKIDTTTADTLRVIVEDLRKNLEDVVPEELARRYESYTEAIEKSPLALLGERQNAAKAVLKAQAYSEGSSIHVTTIEDALSMAEQNFAGYSEASGRVDVQPNPTRIDPRLFKAATRPEDAVAIEFRRERVSDESGPEDFGLFWKATGRQITRTVNGEAVRGIELGDDVIFHSVRDNFRGTRREFIDHFGGRERVSLGERGTLLEQLEAARISLYGEPGSYAPRAGVHVTSMRSAVDIAKSNPPAIQPSDLSGQVDVSMISDTGAPSFALYKGDTNSVAIEIPPGKVTSISAGTEGRAFDVVNGQQTSYVLVNDAKFHTTEGVFTYQEFLQYYGDFFNQIAIS